MTNLRRRAVFFLILLLLYIKSSKEEDDSQQQPRCVNDSFSDSKEVEEARQLHNQPSTDDVEDSLFDPIQGDAICEDSTNQTCHVDWSPPESTVETECKDSDDDDGGECTQTDKHWGSDPTILKMRDQLRQSDHRPPIFLMPGLASTRLIAWKYKACPSHLVSDFRVQDNAWLNLNKVVQMTTMEYSTCCLCQCLKLGENQTDSDCKLRPDEGLDAISSLSPGGFSSDLLVGGTNTVYAWLIQWLADNLGYDSNSIVGLPYDWRLSPDKMEHRDGFLTLTRRRIEAAVQSNGSPGIMVAHSMGNKVFQYFLVWLKKTLQEEAYEKYIQKARHRARRQVEKNILPSWINPSNHIAPTDILKMDETGQKHEQLWELALMEGETHWYDWIEQHLWTYVGLSAPLLGAVNPLRAALSGENMGMPFTDEMAREMERTFGSTHTINPISSKTAFCDEWDIQSSWDEEPSQIEAKQTADSRLACLDDIVTEIEMSTHNIPFEKDPWERSPALKLLLRDRIDWDSDFPMIRVTEESCETKGKSPCKTNSTYEFGPKDVQNGNLFRRFNEIWKEEGDPMTIKREQLKESFWDTKVPNILNTTWERPLIKHIVMAYGVDIPTEVGYDYVKKIQEVKDNSTQPEFDGIPTMQVALWETASGKLEEQDLIPRSRVKEFWKKKPKRVLIQDGKLHHSGDGSVPYLSLSWAHTWLLHAVRARRHSGKQDGPSNPLDEIRISHRPEGGIKWVDGPAPKRIDIPSEKKVEESTDTGTSHPHGTKYKPQMTRFHNEGTSRTTGIEYTTTVLEALTVEHKETTRNYDILAAVFTEVLRYMHDDLHAA